MSEVPAVGVGDRVKLVGYEEIAKVLRGACRVRTRAPPPTHARTQLALTHALTHPRTNGCTRARTHPPTHYYYYYYYLLLVLIHPLSPSTVTTTKSGTLNFVAILSPTKVRCCVWPLTVLVMLIRLAAVAAAVTTCDRTRGRPRCSVRLELCAQNSDWDRNLFFGPFLHRSILTDFFKYRLLTNVPTWGSYKIRFPIPKPHFCEVCFRTEPDRATLLRTPLGHSATRMKGKSIADVWRRRTSAVGRL